MKRGEVWTVSAGGSYAGKPRPAVIVQGDRFDATASITICVFTSDETDAPFFRLLVDPDGANGLEKPSRLMVDKITTVPKQKLGKRIGRLAPDDMTRLNQAILVFLGIA
ncbi:MAG TPA: type II toxin-antitoxin system PemK/MazF family toxin [Gammaproteobacteria bacterium]|nr:type II toxin-antitoxin system PemK/MazF family toxin [Gammaproteobacteria bacterium]